MIPARVEIISSRAPLLNGQNVEFLTVMSN